MRGSGERSRGSARPTGGYSNRGNYRGNDYSAKSVKADDFGVVIAVKETFGFIQPYRSSGSQSGGDKLPERDEQVYYGDREAYSGVSVGDEVSFVRQSSTKGFHAERLRLVDRVAKKHVRSITGLVTREIDFRNAMGAIEVAPESANNPEVAKLLTDKQSLPFFIEDIVPDTSFGSSSIPKKLYKGDEVTFSLSYIPDSSYLRCSDVKFTASNRDRSVRIQIQRMREAGVSPEQGIIETIRNNEFGFIRPVERREQIYFRVDDVAEEQAKLKENMEIEFFVISEYVRGKTSDRAVHLRILPKGTVEFEQTVAAAATGVVIEECTVANNGDEIPGRIRLTKPIVTEDDKTIETIELWRRCLPEELQSLYVGDEIVFDVKKYRPENIHFARAVKLQRFRQLSREYGSIVSIISEAGRKTTGYGFIRSFNREADLYFRIADVLDSSGAKANEAELKVNQIVSLDIAIDDVSVTGGQRGNGNSSGNNSPTPAALRLKSTRVQVLSDDELQHLSQGVNAKREVITPSAAVACDIRFLLLRCDVRGVIVKDAAVGKKDAVGSIQLLPEYQSAKAAVFPRELVDNIADFLDSSIAEATLKHTVTSQRKWLHQIVDNLFPEQLGHESVQLTGNKGSVLRLWKTASLPTPPPLEGKVVTKEELLSDGGHSPVKILSKTTQSTAGDLSGAVLYSKADVMESNVLAKDLEVAFDLYLDKYTHKFVAKSLRLTNDPIPGLEGQTCVGVIEVIVGVKSGKFGFIRCIPSDEKLFFHSSAVSASDAAIVEGQPVSFEIRRVGGVRTATGICKLESSTVDVEEALTEACTALVVDTNQVVLIDAKSCPLLGSKLWNTDYLLSAESIPKAQQSSADNKLFSLIGRAAIPCRDDSLQGTEVGSVVQCFPVANWSKHRHPVAVTTVSVTAVAKVAKAKGAITSTAIRGDALLQLIFGKPLLVSSDRFAALEFCEIQVDDKQKRYCLASEVAVKSQSPPTAQQPARLPQVGDAVEFFPFGDKLAVGAVVFVKNPITYRGPATAINAAVKTGGVQSIVMAKGPPQDTSVGFEDGWRAAPLVSALPWSHLFC